MLQHSVQNGLNWCKSSCHEVASEFFVENAPDPPHCTLNSCFGVFCTIWMHLGVWLPYKTQCKTGRTGAKVRATESHLKFSHQTHPIILVGSQTHILVCFVLFEYIWNRLVALQNSVQNEPKCCKSSCHEVV